MNLDANMNTHNNANTHAQTNANTIKHAHSINTINHVCCSLCLIKTSTNINTNARAGNNAYEYS